MSIASDQSRTVAGLPQTRMVGARGTAEGLNTPMPNSVSCAPPHTMPVMDTGLKNGVSMNHRPGPGGGWAKSSRPMNGDSPHLATAPMLFSISVLRPPARFSGVGLTPL